MYNITFIKHYTITAFILLNINIIDVKTVDKQLTHPMNVKDRYANGTFIDKLTNWNQRF